MVAPISAEFHFWRTPPERWAGCLDAVRMEGISTVSSYLSWRRHAPSPAVIDLAGSTDARLDVRRFLALCRERGLSVHLKPGPWICAEEPAGGYPDWLLEERELLALDQHGEPVVGYFPPYEHHVPSYHHAAYRAHALRWLGRVAEVLADEFTPDGPIVAVQLDNEPGWCFRDGPFEADYNKASIEAFVRWCRLHYGTLEAIGAAWGVPIETVVDIRPPQEETPSAEGRHGEDWVAFKERTLVEHLEMLAGAFVSVPDVVERTYNLCPRAVPSVPSDEAILRRVGPGGPDLYFLPPLDRDQLERAAMDIAISEMVGRSVWAPEFHAGIWRMPGVELGFDAPRPEEQLRFALACLAYGLRSLNFYMAVERENWQHAPIDVGGNATPFVAAIRAVRAIVEGVPGWSESRTERPVVIAWDREAARKWHLRHVRSNEARGAALTPWLVAFRAVLAAGLMPGFADLEQGPVPNEARAIVIPAGTGSMPAIVGPPVITLRDPGDATAEAPTAAGSLAMQLHGFGLLPVAWSTFGDISVVVHRGPRRVVFVINHGETTSIPLDALPLSEPQLVGPAGTLTDQSVGLPTGAVVCLSGGPPSG